MSTATFRTTDNGSTGGVLLARAPARLGYPAGSRVTFPRAVARRHLWARAFTGTADIRWEHLRGIVVAALWAAPTPTPVAAGRSLNPTAWYTSERLDAILGLTREARRIFGPAATRSVVLKNDPEREPPTWAVVSFAVDPVSREQLLDGELELIRYLIAAHPGVEDDITVLCRRRRG